VIPSPLLTPLDFASGARGRRFESCRARSLFPLHRGYLTRPPGTARMTLTDPRAMVFDGTAQHIAPAQRDLHADGHAETRSSFTTSLAHGSDAGSRDPSIHTQRRTSR
jgi:hypothetical protein